MGKDFNSRVTGAFADRLSDLIKESGKTISELAKDIGVSAGILSSYQNDKAVAGVTNLKRIADYFNVSCDYLLGEADCKNPDNEAIRQKIGLSDKSISLLQSNISPNVDYTFILNTLVENGSIESICCEISDGVKKSIDIDQVLDELNQDFDELERSDYVFSGLRSLSEKIESSTEQYQEFLKYKTVQVLKTVVDTTKDALIKHYEKIKDVEFKAELTKLV